MESSKMNQILPMKKAFARIGWGLFACAVAWTLSSAIITALLKNFAPAFSEKYSLILNVALMFIPLYLIGMPLFLLIAKKLPQFKIPFTNSKKMRVRDFVLLLVCGLGCSYVLNFVTVMINALLMIVFGNGLDSLTNNTSSVYQNNYLIGLITVGLMAPILEEFIFRGVLINKLRPYGEGICILGSGLLFGLFHSNLLQIPYAITLGMVFAFVTIRTGTILYSILMHMIVNCYSVTISQVILNTTMSDILRVILTLIIGVIALTVLGVGVTMTIIKAKRCKIKPTSNYLADGASVGFKGTARSFFSSSGIIGFIVLIAVMVVVNFIASI